MEQLQGSLSRGGLVIAPRLGIRLNRPTSSNGARHWTGYFDPPAGTVVRAGECYRLELGDGQAAEIQITRTSFSTGARCAFAFFQTTEGK